MPDHVRGASSPWIALTHHTDPPASRMAAANWLMLGTMPSQYGVYAGIPLDPDVLHVDDYQRRVRQGWRTSRSKACRFPHGALSRG